jgi:hypothetical protein
MTDQASSDQLIRSIKRLTVAVWILSALITINLTHYLIETVIFWIPEKRSAATFSPPQISTSTPYVDSYSGFNDWPLEKQIKASSVIALARYKSEDGRLKCIITDILKQDPSSTFYYKVGDEYTELSQTPEPNTQYGDGEIMFFTGSPASFRFSTSFSGDRAMGLGDMPISVLKETIKQASQ